MIKFIDCIKRQFVKKIKLKSTKEEIKSDKILEEEIDTTDIINRISRRPYVVYNAVSSTYKSAFGYNCLEVLPEGHSNCSFGDTKFVEPKSKQKKKKSLSKKEIRKEAKKRVNNIINKNPDLFKVKE